MRISSVRIEHLRSFSDETIRLDDYTTLIGANGSGKSTVLCALNIFFRETADSPVSLTELQVEDFHNKDTNRPIRITVTFVDLSADAQQDFRDYYRQNQLVLTAIARFDPATGRATAEQHGQRMVMKDFVTFFEALKRGDKVAELRNTYGGFRASHPLLPAATSKTTKDEMQEFLRAYEEAHPELTELIESTDQFYGFSKGTNRLGKYLQWVYVPAVKEPADEQIEGKDTALGELLDRTVRGRVNWSDSLKSIRAAAKTEYDKVLGDNEHVLTDLSNSLSRRLAELTQPDAMLELHWKQDPSSSVKIADPSAQVTAIECGFASELPRKGHGFQRAYLLALLQELADAGALNAPTLLLGIEEPELYQHPPQCRHMSTVLQDLAGKNTQVILTTHSPLFIGDRSFESVRMVQRRGAPPHASVSAVPSSRLSEILATARGEPVPMPLGIRAKIHQSLQPSLNEMFFAPRLVLVEGREDIAHIVTYMNLLGLADDLRRAGCSVVSADRKSALQIPLAIALELGIPTFLVFDGDTNCSTANGNDVQHRNDNLALLRLARVPSPDPWPTMSYWSDRVVMWRTQIGTELEADFDATRWNATKEAARSAFGRVGHLEKNPLFIAETLTTAWESGLRSGTLQRLCEAIHRFAVSPSA